MYNNNLVQDDTTTVEEVLEDFDKVINDASTESGGRRKMSSSVSSDNSKRFYEYISDTDDVVIIPTRIVPEPPRRSRSLFMNKNFEVNPFFEDDEESVDSECAYEEEEEEEEVQEKSKIKRNETFRSVQKQIKRFSDLALRTESDGRAMEEEEKIKDQGRRKSIYNVFGNALDSEKPAYNRTSMVTRSASTRNVNDSRIPIVTRFDHCKSVYLPTASPGRDIKETKVFMTRGHNNAGLYSGYKETTAGKGPSPAKCKLGSNSVNALQHINVLSVSTGKLTDFPSGLY